MNSLRGCLCLPTWWWNPKELVIPPETPLLNFTHLLVYASSSLAEQTTPASFFGTRVWVGNSGERRVEQIQLDSMNTMEVMNLFLFSKKLWVVPLFCCQIWAKTLTGWQGFVASTETVDARDPANHLGCAKPFMRYFIHRGLPAHAWGPDKNGW